MRRVLSHREQNDQPSSRRKLESNQPLLVSIEGCRASATSIEAGNCFCGREVPHRAAFPA
jgi:hypothetical protein